MNGVTVLNTIKGNDCNYFFLALFVVSIIIFIITLIYKSDAVILFMSAVIAVICCILSMPVNTRYEVTISNEVKFNEFNEKYEIISKDGNIYTVEMRENDD
jgi:hypothetical protein